MHVAANRLLGRAVYQLLADHFEAAEIDYPRFTVGTLAEVLDTMADAMLPRIRTLQGLSPEIIDLLIGADPVLRFHYCVYAPMSWTTTLRPAHHAKVVQIIPVLQDFLRQRGCQPVSAEAVEAFNARLLELMAVPEVPGQLNAGGYAIYQAATKRFRSLPPTQKALARRRRCLRAIKKLCFELEAANMATGRSLGVGIAELLEAELRASNYARYRQEMDIFWNEFNLFFHGSQFV